MTVPTANVEYALFREHSSLPFLEFVAPRSAKGSPDKILKIVEDTALGFIERLHWDLGTKPRISIYEVLDRRDLRRVADI